MERTRPEEIVMEIVMVTIGIVAMTGLASMMLDVRKYDIETNKINIVATIGMTVVILMSTSGIFLMCVGLTLSLVSSRPAAYGVSWFLELLLLIVLTGNERRFIRTLRPWPGINSEKLRQAPKAL